MCCSSMCIFAIFVCALAVHASAVRLVFAMARDGLLPCSRALASVSHVSRTPIVPVFVIGIVAIADSCRQHQPAQADRAGDDDRGNVGQSGLRDRDGDTLETTPAGMAVGRERTTAAFRSAGRACRSMSSRSCGACSWSSTSAGRAWRSTVRRGNIGSRRLMLTTMLVVVAVVAGTLVQRRGVAIGEKAPSSLETA